MKKYQGSRQLCARSLSPFKVFDLCFYLCICSVLCCMNKLVHWFCFHRAFAYDGVNFGSDSPWTFSSSPHSWLACAYQHLSSKTEGKLDWPSFIQISLWLPGDMVNQMGIVHPGTMDKVKLKVAGQGWQIEQLCISWHYLLTALVIFHFAHIISLSPSTGSLPSAHKPAVISSVLCSQLVLSLPFHAAITNSDSDLIFSFCSSCLIRFNTSTGCMALGTGGIWGY